jgi:hypothetical protein
VRWDDWTQVTQDFDLDLLRWNGSSWVSIAASRNIQSGEPGQIPAEYVAAVTSGAPTAYGFRIYRFSSTRSVHFEVFAPKSRGLIERLPARSLGNLADVPGAVTVAALDVDDPYSHEDYSAEGPTNGPGGTASGGFVKPDIAGYANVSAQGYGLRGFDGTSAATPHVAGAAALVLGQSPHFAPQQVQAFLEGRAIEMGAPGQDTVHGHGRLYLGNPWLAPTVSGISPSAAVYSGAVHITNLAGSHFRPGATVRLARSNHPPIVGTNVAYVNQGKLTLDLDLTGAANGAWDVIVENPDGQTGVLPEGFTVTATPSAPRVFGITPSSGTGVVEATVVGKDFAQSGGKPTVKLTQVGQDAVVASDVSVVDSATLTCRFDLTGANGGLWNVVVINPNGEHWTLTEAFSITYRAYLPSVAKYYPPPPSVLYAIEDTMVKQGAPMGTYDLSSEMWAGYDHCASGQISRSLIKFDTSKLVAAVPISRATLYVFLTNACYIEDQSRTVTLHRATSFWSDDTVTWLTRPSTTPSIASQVIPPQGQGPWGWYGFDVTELVKGWAEGDYINLGVVLRGPESADSQGARLGFVTRDYAGGVYAPRIQLSYASQASATSAEAMPPSATGCLPEPLISAEPDGDSGRFLEAPLCPAD